MTDALDDALFDPLAPLRTPCGFTPPPPVTRDTRITLDGAALLRSRPRPKSFGESRAAGLRRRRAERRSRAQGG
jgi:hypothetical protein